MSKRITISMKDSLYKNIELRAKKMNCTVRDLLNENIRSTFEVPEDVKKDGGTLKEIQESLNQVFNFIYESQKINIQHSAYSKNILTKLVRSVSKASTDEEKNEKIHEALKESIAESDEIIKSIISGVN